MESDKGKKLVDELFCNLEEEADSRAEKRERKSVSFAVPEDYRSKYELLQEKTNKKFGKRFKELLMEAIDRVSDSLKI